MAQSNRETVGWSCSSYCRNVSVVDRSSGKVMIEITRYFRTTHPRKHLSACVSFPCVCTVWILTFSMPKNLSLPSSRMGPASSRCFSKGVKGGALGSFLAVDDPVDGLAAYFLAEISVRPMI